MQHLDFLFMKMIFTVEFWFYFPLTFPVLGVSFSRPRMAMIGG